jgi:hypothetical protein
MANKRAKTLELNNVRQFVEVLAEAEKLDKKVVSTINSILKMCSIECKSLNRIGWETG